MPEATDPQVKHVIEALGVLKFSAATIETIVREATKGDASCIATAMPGLHAELKGKKPPALRTIQRLLGQMPTDDDAPWGLGDAKGEDARLILETQYLVFLASEGRRQHLTKREAAWVARVRKASPGMPPFDAVLWAYEYLSREANKQSTEDLDIALAYCSQPDTLEEREREWERLARAGVQSPHDDAIQFEREAESIEAGLRFRALYRQRWGGDNWWMYTPELGEETLRAMAKEYREEAARLRRGGSPTSQLWQRELQRRELRRSRRS